MQSQNFQVKALLKRLTGVPMEAAEDADESAVEVAMERAYDAVE